MADSDEFDPTAGLSRRQALLLLGAIGVAAGVDADALPWQLPAPRNLRVTAQPKPSADSPVVRNVHPRTYLTPAMLNDMRDRLVSDAAFRDRWRTAVSEFEAPGGDWAQNNQNYYTIAFAAFLTCVRRPNNDLGLTWKSSWQSYRDRIVGAAFGTIWQKALFVETAYAPAYWAAAMIFDLLYNDLTEAERGQFRTRIQAWANLWRSNPYHWNDQDSDDLVATVLCGLSLDDASSRVDRLLGMVRPWAESRNWMGFASGVGYETKEYQPTQVGPILALYFLQTAAGLTAADTTDLCIPTMRDGWQLYRHFNIAHPAHVASGRQWVTDHTNMAGPVLYAHRSLQIAPNMIWALALLKNQEPLLRYLTGELNYSPPSSPTQRLKNVVTCTKINAGSSTATAGNAQAFYAFIPWLILNAQEREPTTGEEAGISRVRRWWPGTLDWTTIRSGFDFTTASLISYHHRKYHVSNYEQGCRQNGSWHAHRAGPLLVQRGSGTHVLSTRFITQNANGTITFADTTLPEGTPHQPNVDVTDWGGVRPGSSTHSKTEAIDAGPINDFGDVTRWFADEKVVVLTSDLTHSYNSSLFAYRNGGPGNEPKVSSFTREFVVVQRGGDGTDHERIFTYDRLAVLGNGRFEPMYNLNPGPPQIDIDGKETAYEPWLPAANGPTRWDYANATRMIVANSEEPQAPIPGAGRVCVTWLQPSGGGVRIRKRGGTNVVNDPKIPKGNPFFNQYGGVQNDGREWTGVSGLEQRAYCGLYRVEIIPAAFTPDTRFLIVADMMDAPDAPSVAEQVRCDVASVAARCGATVVVFARDGSRNSGSVTVPAGVTLVVLVNLSGSRQRTLTGGTGLTITTANRTASESGVLTVGVSGSGELRFA